MAWTSFIQVPCYTFQYISVYQIVELYVLPRVQEKSRITSISVSLVTYIVLFFSIQDRWVSSGQAFYKWFPEGLVHFFLILQVLGIISKNSLKNVCKENKPVTAGVGLHGSVPMVLSAGVETDQALQYQHTGKRLLLYCIKHLSLPQNSRQMSIVHTNAWCLCWEKQASLPQVFLDI